VGTVSLMGWTLDIMSALGMIIVVGLSVDYTAHLVHACNKAPSPDRLRKAKNAAVTLGTSVLAGAVTTAMTAVPLLFANITFFIKFGTFILITVLYSWSVAMFFVLPLTALFGSESNSSENARPADSEEGSSTAPPQLPVLLGCESPASALKIFAAR